MRSTNRARVLGLLGWLIAGAACRSDVEPTTSRALERISPSAVSNVGGWSLFDRSISSGYTPDDRVLTVDLARSEAIAAIKVRGGSAYSIHVRGRGGASLGFPAVDLSTLPAGWHVIESSANTSTEIVELSFIANGAAAPIPELELWTVASGTSESVRAEKGVISFAASESSQQIAPGTCELFRVEIPRAPALFQRMHLSYEATGLFRPFAIERSINGRASVGGFWLHADVSSPRAFVEQIDPDSLALGKNTLRFCVPAAATAAVTLSDVRLIGELDRGDQHVTKVTVESRDGGAALDGRDDTRLSVAPGEHMRLDLDRLVAPDAIVTDVAASVADVSCIGKDDAATTLTFEDAGGLLQLNGGARACAAINVGFDAAVSLGEIAVIGSSAGERVDWPRIVVTSEAEHFGAVAWVGGFVVRPTPMHGAVRVDVDAKATEPTTGEFGQAVKRTSDVSGAWAVDVAAHLADGSQQMTKVVLASDRVRDLVAQGNAAQATSVDDAARFGALGTVTTADVTMLGHAKIRLGTHAGIDIPAGAVVKATKILAKRLDRPVLPPLDPGMVNVTAPRGSGYEYLPHGQRFAKNVEVIVPFDPKLLPDGTTPDDVHTYYYDDQARRWRKLQRNSIDLGDRVLRSASDHFTIMINAVLAVPTNPTPLAFDPTSLTSIAAASPGDGIDLIEPPVANSQGDARLGLPLRLPAGRGAYMPSLSIGYSSAADNGWLGVGWNLAVSTIEIDTRWGVPRYTDDEEPRYLLDGAELMPTLEVEGPTCMGARRYHTRVEGSYAHILRCGTNPANYYWIVHDRDGTRFMYGRDGNGNTANANLVSTRARPCNSAPCGNGIFRWHLREVVDANQNTTTFSYQVDDVAGAEPSRGVYPDKIEYTSHPSKPAAYSVELVLDGSTRPDRIVSARGGFKQMTRKLLRAVRVKFQSQIIREYVLTYRHGQFDKTVLSSVRAYGVGGCGAGVDAFVLPVCTGEFHEHTFGYFADNTEIEGFAAAEPWAIQGPPNGDPSPSEASLGKGRSKTWAGTMSLGTKLGPAEASVGVNGSTGDREELVGFYDINGDGLPDQVLDTGSSLRVLYNRGATQAQFSTTGPALVGLSKLGREKHSSWGVDAKVGIKVGRFGASASGGFANSTARAGRILTDLDGDGFIDVLASGSGNGGTLFSTPVAGWQRFDPGTFGSSSAVNPGADPLLNNFAAEIDERLALGDPIVQWTAPYSGAVGLATNAFLVSPTSASNVRVELYLNDQLIWESQQPLTATNPSVTNMTGNLRVTAGDGLYLRIVTSGGTNATNGVRPNEVYATLSATYQEACSDRQCSSIVPIHGLAKEPFGRSVWTFTSVDELHVNAVRPLLLPAQGTVQLQGNIAKQVTAAPVRVCLQRFPAGSTETDVRCAASNNIWGPATYSQAAVTAPVSVAIAANVGDLVVLRAESDFSFDARGIAFGPQGQLPVLAYTQACIPSGSGGGCTSTTDPLELEQIPLDVGAFGFFVAPVAHPEPYGAPPMPYVAVRRAVLSLPSFPHPFGGSVPITVAIRSDRSGTMQVFNCSSQTCFPASPWITVQLDDSLSIEVVADTLPLPALYTSVQVGDGSTPRTVPLIFRYRNAPPILHRPFVGGFRGWASAFWNQQIEFGPTALLFDYANPDDLSLERLEEMSVSAFEPTPSFTGAFSPKYVGRGSSAFVSRWGHMQAGKLGASPPVTPGQTLPDPGVFAGDYVRLSGTRSYYAGVGVTGGDILPDLKGQLGLNLSATVSRSTTTTTTDVIDVTGDGIPDVVAADRTIRGSLSTSVGGEIPELSFGGSFRRRVGLDYSIGLGGDASQRKTTAGGRTLMQALAKLPKEGLGGSHSVGLAVGRSQTTDDLADVNGDGLVDVIRRRGTSIEVRYNLGTSLGAWETIGTIDPALASTSIDNFQSFEDATSMFGKTFDSTSDALEHTTTLTEHDTYSVNALFVSYSRTTRTTSSRTTRQLVDLNGDGLPDLLLKKHGEPIWVQYNRGSSFGPATQWTTPSWTVSIAPSFNPLFAALTVAGSKAIAGPDVLAGTGSQTATTHGGSAEIPLLGSYLSLGVSGSRSNDVDTYELALVDVTGDGAPDHVLRRGQTSAANLYVKRNRLTGRSNVLSFVNRPLGGKIALGYAEQGNNPDMPQRKLVLSRVEVDDGVDLGADFASPNLVTTFGYQDGYHDRLEKQFFGFAKVTTRRPDGGTIEHHYENHSYALSGMLTKEIRKDSASAIVFEQRVTYHVEDVIGPGGALVAHPDCVSALHPLLQRIPNNDACTPKVPVVVQEDEIQGELGTTAKKTRATKDTSRDRFGNVLVSEDAGDAAIATDDLYITAGYQNDTTRWILGRPDSLQVRGGGPMGPMLRARTAIYNPQGKVRELSVETGTGLATTKLDYDAYGNLERFETPPNANGETQIYTVGFDPTVATYPTSTSDEFGYTSTAAYDLRFGAATTQTDTNGAQLVRALDNFGRLSTVRGPYDPVGSPALELHYYPSETPPRATTTTRTSAPPGYSGPLPPPLHTVTIADGFGRAIQLRKTAVVDGVAGMTTMGLVQRDALGRVTKSWHPSFTAGASTSFVSPVATLATTSQYDQLDRVITTTHPDGSVENTSYSIATSPTGPQLFKTRHEIPMSPIARVREQYSDQLGRMRAHVEYAAANSPAVTSYDYTATGELRTIVDAESNTTTVGYDLRGLRTTLANPDTGLREEQFDLMGNRVALIEPNHRANGTQVTFAYDRNRLESIDYPSKPSVTFEYGAPGATDSRAGRVTRVTDETGSLEYFYGALGETRRSLRTFHPAGNTQPLHFDHRFTTDSLSRQLQLRYPDGEVVANIYDAAGMLTEVRGEGDGWQRSYASDMRYDVFGNRTRIKLGEVITTWSFEPARVRLDRVTSTIVGGSNSKFQDLDYDYDAASNPTSITNSLAPLPTASGAMPGSSSLTLTYDGLDRLKRIVGTAQLDATRTTTYDQSFGYTPSHNLDAKRRVHLLNDGVNAVAPPATNFSFTYQYSTRPHLPDQVGDLQLQYDPSGNPKRRLNTSSGFQQTLVWDDDNRLVQLTDTAGVSQGNLYDSSGLRVRRKTTTSSGARTTIFASAFFDLNGEQASSNGGVKHVFAGELRIASVLGTFESSANPAAPDTPGAAYFLHGDHLGSTSVITDEDGAVHQSVEYFADGELWIDRAPATPFNGYLFNGKPFDAETGFYDYGQRFYDPRTSLWLGVDPALLGSAEKGIGQPLYLSVSAFTGQNPQRYRDDDGRDYVLIHKDTIEYVVTPTPYFQGYKSAASDKEAVAWADQVRRNGYSRNGDAGDANWVFDVASLARAAPALYQLGKHGIKKLLPKTEEAWRRFLPEAERRVAAAAAKHGRGTVAMKPLENQLPQRLASELDDAASVGVRAAPATRASLERVANEGTLKYVVTESGQLVVVPHTVSGIEISHAVLSGGQRVLVAGHVEIAAAGGKVVGLAINANSGHFGNGSLQLAKEAFAKLGVSF